MTVIVDHDTGALVWAKAGRDMATLRAFCDLLGKERCEKIRLVSADGADWITRVVRAKCKRATLCMDPFHVVKWCTDALDEVRRDVWNAARKGGMKALAGDLKGARFALWKNPEDLTDNQKAKLSWVQKTNNRLYRAYLIKEQLRLVFKLRGEAGIALLKAWLAWAGVARPYRAGPPPEYKGHAFGRHHRRPPSPAPWLSPELTSEASLVASASRGRPGHIVIPVITHGLARYVRQLPGRPGPPTDGAGDPEKGPAVPELIRRIAFDAPRVDPAKVMAQSLVRAKSLGLGLGDVLADCGYSNRDPQSFAVPLGAAGATLMMDLHPADPGPRGTFEGAICANGRL